MAGHPCLTLRSRSLSLQGDPANIGRASSRPARCTRGAGDRFGIPNPRKSGPVIGADRQRFSPSCVLLKRVPQGRTESGSTVLAANAGPRVPSGGVTLKRRCTYRHSVIYLIVNKLLSLSLSQMSTAPALFFVLLFSPLLIHGAMRRIVVASHMCNMTIPCLLTSPPKKGTFTGFNE